MINPNVMGSEFWLISLATIWIIWLPGVFLERVLRLDRLPTGLQQLCLQLGLGIAFWPTLFLWSAVFGGQWSSLTAQISMLGIGIGGLVALIVVPGRRWQVRLTQLRQVHSWPWLFGFIVILTLATRLLHISQLSLPNWVDSVHHVMIVRLLTQQGTLPTTYTPFIPTGEFLYHWGYHVHIALLAWLLDRTDPFSIAQIVLYSGQVFNILVVLMLYIAGYMLLQNERAGLLAAVFGMLVSWFPAYYVSWGRYTQLLGLLLIMPFILSLWQLFKRPAWGNWLAAVLMGSGILLIHLRISLFIIPLIGILGIWLVFYRAWFTLIYGGAASIAAVLLTMPWWLILLRDSSRLSFVLPTSTVVNQQWWISQNVIPWPLIWAPGNHELLTLATGGVSGILGWGDASIWLRIASGLWALALITSFLRYLYQRPTKDNLPQPAWSAYWLLLLWCSVTAILLNLDKLNLPALGFVHNSSAVIILFVPLSIASGGLVAWVIDCVVSQRWQASVTIILVLSIAIFGAYKMRDIVNPSTILAQKTDLEALHWIRDNTPPTAKFAVNVWRWQGNAYAGSDGGYWIKVLTDREVIVPPALYTLFASADSIAHTNALLDRWAQTSSLDDPEIREKLHEAGVTHIYIGARGGHLRPDLLIDHPFVSLVYKNGPVYIFALVDE